MQERNPLGDLPAAFLLQNVLQLHQQRSIILRVDSLALWKKFCEENVIIPQNRVEVRNFPADFSLGIVWGGVSRYAATQ
jgi:hypothetical protein